MRRTFLILAFALAAVHIAAQTERQDSAGRISSEVLPEARPEISLGVAADSDFLLEGLPHPDFSHGAFTLDADGLHGMPLMVNPLALPAEERPFSLPNVTLSSGHDVMYGLGDIRRAALGYGLQAGRWSFDAAVVGEKYRFQTAAFNNFAIDGSVSYRLSDNWSLTAFGTYSTGRHYYSMAAYPYITQSRFGGTVNYSSGKFGLRLGARQLYDPFRRQWITEPVVAPSVTIGKMRFEPDFGPLLHDIFRRAVLGRRNNGPIIMPQTP